MIEQVANVCQTTIALDAWERGQELAVHGWIYGLQDGLLRDLNVTVAGAEETSTVLSRRRSRTLPNDIPEAPALVKSGQNNKPQPDQRPSYHP